MSERLSADESFENRDTLLQKLQLVSEALALFSSSSEENQQQLVEHVLPHLSEELGIVLDASQDTWEFLAGQKELLESKLRRLE